MYRLRFLCVLAGAAVIAAVGSVASLGSPAGARAPAWAPVAAAGEITAPPSEVTVGGLELENKFVSSVGWVKPGDSYPSRLILTNTTAAAIAGATVTVAAPAGTRFSAATGPGAAIVTAGNVTWTAPSVPAGGTVTLVVQSVAASLAQLPTVVWRDLSTTATLTVAASSAEATSHGPKVIPPDGRFDSARYGDRPFPVVPVAYADRDYQPTHDGGSLAGVINDPDLEGSTFNLYQEMSLGQLYPEGTVPSAELATADFSYGPGFEFTSPDPSSASTCTGGLTLAGQEGTPVVYEERVVDGVYQLPGNTAYYGADGGGSAVIGALAGVGALMQVDSGCGPTGKLVWDSAAIADPEIDYSDYDTDKDGVVDFFMAVFAGCGGNGASQLSVAGCTYPDAPYDNVWPHSSSLEYYYTDPETGLTGYISDDQLRDLSDRPLFYVDTDYDEMTTTDTGLPVFVRVGPYNVNPETAIDHASVISHEYGHSLGLPDFYSLGSRGTYGSWNLMASDHSQHIDVFGRQELGWIVPQALDPDSTFLADAWTDSKQDIDTITWETPDGTPYTLTEGADGRVQNAEAYVAKLPGRVLLPADAFDRGEGASATHTWWSRSGNDFGCASDGGGHNIDLWIPGVEDLPAGSTVELSFKSMFDIEWDYDYGFVLTSTDGGQSFTSHASTAAAPTTTTANANANTCQQTYSNGITGSSGSHAAGTAATDRIIGSYPEMEWVTDTFDVSDLAGAQAPVLRFSYATDPGLARPGWFIDDLTVTATLPDNSTRVLFESDLESSGGPDDPRVFNGGCQGDAPGGACTDGWQYVSGGSEGPADHAYYLELRDRSGFDLDGNGQSDRGEVTWTPGVSLVYTDEAHGYGNVGTDDPPAQSPLDSQPVPGDDDPDLDDAAWTAAPGDSHFTDFAGSGGHTDNYTSPTTASGNWEFNFGCLSFDVLSMAGDDVGPAAADGNLTADVQFDLGAGCAEFAYSGPDPSPPPPGGPPTPPPPPGDESPFLVSVDPARYWDSRDLPTFDSQYTNTGRLAAGATFAVQIAGRGDVPIGAKGVVANITVEAPDAPGHATLFPCGTEPPIASHLNFVPGEVLANNVVVPLSTDGKVCVATHSAAHFVLDVNGYVDPAAPPTMLEPARYLETRAGRSTFDTKWSGGGPLAAGQVIELPVTTRGDVPADATAAILNVTAVLPSAPGYLTLYPCDEPRPVASTLNFIPGQAVPNGAMVELSSTGTVCIFTLADTDLIVDVAGYVPASVDSVGLFNPARFYDSRAGEPLVDGSSTETRLGARETREIQIEGRNGFPDWATAAILNVVAVTPDGPGYVTLYPCNGTRPVTSNLNFVAGMVRANNAVTALSADGKVCAYTLVGADLVVDVMGYVG